MKIRRLIPPLTVAVCLALLFSLTAHLALRSLHLLPMLGADFAAIFAQIADAPIHAPGILVFLAAFVGSLLTGRLWRRGVWGRIGSVLFVLLGGLTLWTLTFLLTEVNGVLVFDVARTLIPALMGGLL